MSKRLEKWVVIEMEKNWAPIDVHNVCKNRTMNNNPPKQRSDAETDRNLPLVTPDYFPLIFAKFVK